MSFGFAAPLALTSLVALVLPILLHFARREETRIEMFAALRWLRPGARPTSRVRFDEWLLFLVRSLLIATVAAWLAQPYFVGSFGALPTYVAIVPGVDPDEIARLAPASDATERHWLVASFPTLDASAPNHAASFSSLLRELDATLPPEQALTVIVPPELAGMDAERPHLSRAVKWLVTGSRAAADVSAAAGSSAQDASSVGRRDSLGSQTAEEPNVAAKAGTQTIAVRYDADGQPALRFVEASVAAWNVDSGGDRSISRPARGDAVWTLDAAPLDTPIADGVRYVIVIGESIPASVLSIAERGVRVVHVPSAVRGDGPPTRDETARRGQGTIVTLRRPFDPAQMPELLEPTFPTTLREWITGPAPPPSRVTAAMAEPRAGARPYPPTKRSMLESFAWAILILLALERLLATRGKRFRQAAT